ncbi:MAG: NAD-dependent succinate-semialdehyde dehydrogenase [Candidatus Nanopelagicales bacterium]
MSELTERLAVPTDLYIGGQWRPSASGQRREVLNPATEQVIATVPESSAADIDDALESAQAGFAVWRATSAWERSAVLRAMCGIIREEVDRYAEVMTGEQGKPLDQARAEVLASADQFDWYADEARRIYGRTIDGHTTDTRITVRREPIGPVAAFAAWNFPSLLPARKIAPALAAGCSVIAMPPIESPLSCLLFAEAAERAGLPAGVLNMITGEPSEISERLLAGPIIRKVSLTGSVPVGIILNTLAARTLKSVSMELGGHSPVLVFPDADLESAARAAALGKFRNAGQVCISASRFLVHESIVQRFTEVFVEQTRALRLGPGADPNTDMGPLGSAKRRESVEALVADAVSKGATVAHGGFRPEEFAVGFFFAPTVLTGVSQDMDVMTEEPFGPIAPITSFSTFDEAISLANSTAYGLAGFVYTRDLDTAYRASEALETGMVGVNHLTIATAEAPFGGVKYSGFGREGGTEGILDYTHAKYVNILLPGPPPLPGKAT